jgi:hypothetical protein
MSSTMFMVDGDNQLSELTRSAFISEDIFQRLLADHPVVLTHASGGTGGLLLVRREAPVPEQHGGSGRWSLDHLFLDREGVPVLVEVKRASDTRARREVVAQMLDYAANGVAYWPVEQLLESFEATWRDEEADKKLADFLDGADPEAFWRQVESNLRSGRVRMVFVADQIPGELRRIVEFLNEQMRPAEVLAIEVEHFTTSTGVRLLSPRLVGATERAKSVKSVQPGRPPIDEEEWLASLAEIKGELASQMARKLLDWYRAQGAEVGMTASQDAMYARLMRPDGKPTWPFFVRKSSGKAEISLQYLKDNPAFAADEARAAILEQMKSLPGVPISTSKLTGWPAAPLEALAQKEVWDAFEKALRTIIDKNRDQ